MPKEIWIVGGPNGAGKTTWVKGTLSAQGDTLPYLSADQIAAELAPGRPEKAAIAAGREFLRQLREAIESGEELIVESTLSGRGMTRYFQLARDHGYRIVVVFIFLRRAELCVRRVQQRVRKGGHDVPEVDILRRYARSRTNFWNIYRHMADSWHLFFNDREESFLEVAMGETDMEHILETELFELFLKSEDKSHET